MTALRGVSLAAVLLALSAGVTLAQTVPDFAGRWSGPIQGGAATGTFDLRQEDRKVTGTYERSDAPDKATFDGAIRADGVLVASMVPPGGEAVSVELRLTDGALVAAVLIPGAPPREATFRRAPVANPLGGPPPQNPLGAPRANPLATPPPPPWAGTWSDGAVKLVLEPAAEGAFRGAITVQGTTYPVKGAAQPPRLEGTFDVQGHAFAFTAALEGAVLTLTSEGATYRLRKEGATNPLAAGRATGPTTGAAPAASGPALTGVYDGPAAPFRHSTGFTLDLPQGWAVQSEQEGVVLLSVPPGKDNTLEAMVMISHGEPDEADRGKTPGQLMAELGPSLHESFSLSGARASSEPRAVVVSGVQGAEASWTGTLQNGIPALLWAGGVISDKRFVVVVALIQQGREGEHLARAKRLLASTRLGE
jgi:hypothetical protein